MPEPLIAAASTLTDGTGVSSITSNKLVKDFVLDVLLALPAAFLAVNIGSVEQAVAAPAAAGFVLADTVGRALYRVALRWAQS